MSAVAAFDRQDETDAAGAVAEAQAARSAAVRALMMAPRGKTAQRREALARATHALLEAELVLKRVREGLA